MPDPLKDYSKRSNLIEDEQPPCSSKTIKTDGFLILLSGIVVAATLGVGLLAVIIFINPQGNIYPLRPTESPVPYLVNRSSSGSRSVLPPTWTPTIIPTDTPTKTPTVLPTDIPTSLPTSTNTPVSDVVKSQASSTEIVSDEKPDLIETVGGCSGQEFAGQIDNNESIPHDPELAATSSQQQPSTAATAVGPAEQSRSEAQSMDAGISDIFTPEIQYWEEDILIWAEEYGLDPNLIATVIQIESCGYTKAKSAAGAMGLFQVMPHHFNDKEDPYDPDINAFRGLSWLQRTLKSGGSIRMALAGYNAGIARVKNPNLNWPEETQRYATWGVNIYQAANCDYEYSDALENWLSKGGSSLCDRAAVYQKDQ